MLERGQTHVKHARRSGYGNVLSRIGSRLHAAPPARHRLCGRLQPLLRLPERHAVSLVGLKYFTAKVQDRPGDEGLERRQQTYLRALATVPDLSVHLGKFMTRPVTRAVVNPTKRGRKFCEVWQTEEKGSDVNLASHLLIDGFRARYDLAVVISNDSDLKEPIRFVREDLKAAVGVLNPHNHRQRSWALSPRDLPLGSFYKPIRAGALASSQFPDTLTDAKGRFHKPKRWKISTP